VSASEVLRFVAVVLSIGVPLSALGLYLYPMALHAGFVPVFVLVPFMLLDGRFDFTGTEFAVLFVIVQLAYYAIVVACAMTYRRCRGFQRK
jgi:hypothetical protein